MPLAHAVWAGLGRAGGALPGPWLAPLPQLQGRADVLIHAASAGEVKAALAVREVLRERHPERRVLVSTGTPAGLSAGADGRLPRDVPRHLHDALDRVQPAALVLIEGEIWPNLLEVAARRGLPVGVLGARLSPSSARAHRLVASSARRWFGRVAAWAAATDTDAARLRSLGVPEQRIEVTGWLKWPAAPAHVDDPIRDALIAEHVGSGPLFVLGSVHPGEVRLAAQRLEGTILDPGSSRWVVVPRHANAARRIRRESPVSSALDSRFGALRRWFAVADAALVGGGATGRATHDLLEPLQAGLRPLFFDDSQDEIGTCLLREDLATPIAPRATLVLTAPPGAWERLRAARDGRLAGLQFLASRGVPALP